MAVGRDGHVGLLSLVLSLSLSICFCSQSPGDAIFPLGCFTSPLESFATLGWRYFKPSHYDEWKVANVVHVCKKGRKDCVENYRPISLLPLVSKVLERCVLARARDHLYHFISPAQHGFFAGRSSVTQSLTCQFLTFS